MTTEHKTLTIDNVSRRGFLQGMLSASAFVICVRKFPLLASAAKSGAPLSPTVDTTAFHPGVYVGINPDGTVVIVAHRTEMGNGVRTSLPRIVADELDADWSRVTVIQGDGDDKYGSQDTDGSHSVREFFEPLREAGATARLMLVRAAAEKWGVPAEQCLADPPHFVSHKTSNRQLGYGELAELAAKQPVPKKDELKLKSRSEWRYIGRSIDDAATLKTVGVKQTIPIDPFKPPHAFQPLGGVAVIADNTWSAFKGRKQLKIDWDNGPNAAYTSADYKKQLQETARQPGKPVHSWGDADAGFSKGGKVIEAEYFAPHLAHASMEPPAAVADVHGDKVTVWAPTQNPVGVREEVAKALGLKKEDVVCHVTFLGGGFGRKSKPDFAVEAAVLSKKTGKPVKVVWSREDDIKFDYYHSVAAMYLKAAVDQSGKPTAWLQRSVFPPISSTFDKDATYGSAGEMSLGWDVIPFEVANFRAENGPAAAHVRIGWLRSVANIYHAFAVQSFANELAVAANRDAYDYLMELIGSGRVVEGPKGGNQELANKYPYDIARLRHVAELAASKANWGKKKSGNGWAMGIAVHRSFLTYVATVVEVEVDPQGAVRIPNVYTALDAGIVANPDMVQSQFQGAAVFGTSLARTGQITATNGAVDQSNFFDYPVARMNDAPAHVDVQIVESDAPPAGVGEPGVPPFAPALCNAIYAATGKRVRELPLSRNGFA
ncbi:MAG: twin-arginine translocation pathway signal protein [Acidobacteria bacterium 13_1_20CM_4_56_7]|nr:MAG: twin-arginine translocation pathway signal protein [Acidobacteria bacterium 13_1_20CM_4_56_7]